MIRNYFKIAFRNLVKHRVYSIINVFGLMIGIACFVIIALYVFDELTFDRFHRNADYIYRVVEERTSETGKQTKVAATSYQLSEQASGKLPGIIDKARMTVRGRTLVKAKPTDKGFQEENWLVSTNFLQFFDFKMSDGDRKTALIEPNSLVITEETAIKYFGTTNAVGKTLSVGNDSNYFTVKGILKNFPANSHITFNMATGESTIPFPRYKEYIAGDWTSNTFFTFLLLDKSANTKKLEQQMEQMLVSNRTRSTAPASNIVLQPLKDIHFYSNDIESSAARTGIRAGGNVMYIYVFCSIALFVLLIACINYINLTTARFSNRAREIAVRKVAGADRKAIMLQFLSEALLMTLIAMILALMLVNFTLPFFNNFSGKHLHLGFIMDYCIWIGIAGIAVIAGLSSGIYPAFILSGFKPIMLLKNKINLGKGSLSIRRSLVVFQFTLSIIMIVATMVVYLQLQYVNRKDMGFNKEQLVVIDINSGAVRKAAETFKAEYAKLPGVTSVCGSSRVPGEWKVLPKVKIKPLASEIDGKEMYFICADENFFKTFEIKLAKGRNFSNQSRADSTAIIINETAAKLLDISGANEQLVSIPAYSYGGDMDELSKPFISRVIGIVKDFNFRSLHEPVSPLVIAYQKNPVSTLEYYTAKISPVNVSKTLKRMEDIMHTVDRGHIFEYHFLDKQWNLFYIEDQKRQTIFLSVGIMTILIACLGLFGLATYAAEQRIKEIGIRKVLGASVSGIVSLLSKSFIKLVSIAALIAFPVSWWTMNSWLKNFAYRINISWWVFGLAGLFAVAIALLTISFQAVKAALANPIKNLRTE
jgi:putative ABC transport system permease protein